MRPVCASATSTSPVLSMVTPPLGAVSALAAAIALDRGALRGERCARATTSRTSDTPPTAALAMMIATRAACARWAVVAGRRRKRGRVDGARGA